MAIVLYEKNKFFAQEIAKALKKEGITAEAKDDFNGIRDSDLILIEPEKTMSKINKIDNNFNLITIWDNKELEDYIYRSQTDYQKDLGDLELKSAFKIYKHNIICSDLNVKKIIESGIKPIFNNKYYGYILYLDNKDFEKANNSLIRSTYLLQERFPRIRRMINIKNNINYSYKISEKLPEKQLKIINEISKINEEMPNLPNEPDKLSLERFKNVIHKIDSYIEILKKDIKDLNEIGFDVFANMYTTPSPMSKKVSLQDDLLEMVAYTGARLDAASGFWIFKTGKKLVKKTVGRVKTKSKEKRKIKRLYKNLTKAYKIEIKTNEASRNYILTESFLELAMFFRNLEIITNNQVSIITKTNSASINAFHITNSLTNVSDNLKDYISKINVKDEERLMLFDTVSPKMNELKNSIDAFLKSWKNSFKKEDEIEREREILSKISVILSHLTQKSSEIRNKIQEKGIISNILKNFISSVEIDTYFEGSKKDVREIKKVSKDLSNMLIEMVRESINEIENDKKTRKVSMELTEAWEYVKNSVKIGGRAVTIERIVHITIFVVVLAVIAGGGYILWRQGYLNFIYPVIGWIKGLFHL